jgi:hypothetical protein
LQCSHFPNSLDDDMKWLAEILILFSNTEISKISSQLEMSNVYLILFYRLFLATGYRTEQMNGFESGHRPHLSTHLLGLFDIINILFLTVISVFLTSSNTWSSILFALTEELAHFFINPITSRILFMIIDYTCFWVMHIIQIFWLDLGICGRIQPQDASRSVSSQDRYANHPNYYSIWL